MDKSSMIVMAAAAVMMVLGGFSLGMGNARRRMRQASLEGAPEPQAPLAAQLPEAARKRIEAKLRDNRIIDAVKIYREEIGDDLRQSKEAIDAMLSDMDRR